MRQVHIATATERQTAIVARDWQLFSEHPTLVVIARPYRTREVPDSPEALEADTHPEAWAMVVVNITAGSYRLLVRREQARTMYDSLLREYRRREPRATGRYELAT